MQSIIANSDALLRPDIGLVLPTLATLSNQPSLLLFSSALQFFKWQSGCGCFTSLCLRKKLSIRAGAIFLALLTTSYFFHYIPMEIAMVASLFTFESIDTKILKALFLLSAYLLPTPLAVLGCIIVVADYMRLTGWRFRMSESKEIFLSNSMWLITKDIRLAKRVNNKGEYHLEYENENGEIILVGDGRLIGNAGKEMKNGLKEDAFVKENGNIEALCRVLNEGKVVRNGGVMNLKN